MRIERVLWLAGSNVWSPHSVLEIRLRPETANFGGQCSLESARKLCDLLCNLRQEAGEPCGAHWVCWLESQEFALCAIEFADEILARRCAAIAGQMLAAVKCSESLPSDELIQALRAQAGERRLGRVTGPIVTAARARGIPAFRLDDESLVQLGHGSRQRRVRTATTDQTGFIAEAISRDKVLTKSLLARMGLPVPSGRAVLDEEDAWLAVTQLGGPAVVKPRDADFGNGVSLRLTTRDAVMAAYRKARQFSQSVFVERYLEGFPHRVFVVGESIIGAVRREPARIVGDGTSSVTELIAELNRDPRRGPHEDKTTPWYFLTIDDGVLDAIARQGLSLESVPAAGQIVPLRWESCDWQGDWIFDASYEIAPDVAESLIDAVRAVGLDVAGVDLIANDLQRPLDEQDGGILEINAEPAILVHMAPVCRPSRPIPEAIVANLFPYPEAAHVPIVAMLADDSTPDVVRHLSDQWQESGQRIGRASRDGVWINSRRIQSGPTDNSAGVRSLLLHPRVDAVVCELSAESLRDDGTPFERCNVAVLLSSLTPANSHRLHGENASLPLSVEKLLAQLAARHGFVVVNADDLQLAALSEELGSRAIPISLADNHERVQAARESNARAAFVRGRCVVLANGRHELQLHPPRLDLSTLAALATAWVLDLPQALQCRSTASDSRFSRREISHQVATQPDHHFYNQPAASNLTT